jgi:integrase
MNWYLTETGTTTTRKVVRVPSIVKRARNGRTFFEAAVVVGGKRRSKSFATRREAEAWAAEMITHSQPVEPETDSTKTLGTYLELWLRHKMPDLAAKTQRRYRGMIDLHLQGISDLPIADIKPATLREFLLKLRDKGLGPSSIRYARTILHGAFELAVEDGLVPHNPASGIRLKGAGPMPPRQFLTQEDTVRLLAALAGHRLYALVYVALSTGMRLGELLALHWRDVDLEQGTIRVAYSLESAGKLRIKEPKTQASIRVVTIGPDTIRILRQHRKTQLEEKILYRLVYDDQDLVFATLEGTPIHPSNVYHRLFKPAAKAAGVPWARFHDLRHAHASFLIAAGVNAKTVQERLGHRDIRTTLQTYSHVFIQQQKEAAQAIESFLGGG